MHGIDMETDCILLQAWSIMPTGSITSALDHVIDALRQDVDNVTQLLSCVNYMVQLHYSKLDGSTLSYSGIRLRYSCSKFIWLWWIFCIWAKDPVDSWCHCAPAIHYVLFAPTSQKLFMKKISVCFWVMFYIVDTVKY